MPLNTAYNIYYSEPVQQALERYGLKGHPHVNVFDQALFTAQARNLKETEDAATEFDKPTYKDIIRGLASMAGINTTTESFRRFLERASENIASVSPFLHSIFPETWQNLHGRRGSALRLARAIQQAHPDRPSSEVVPYVGDIFRRIYNTGSLKDSAGLSSEYLGSLYQEMQARGLLGDKGGIKSDVAAKRLSEMAGALRAMHDVAMAQRYQQYVRRRDPEDSPFVIPESIMNKESIAKRGCSSALFRRVLDHSRNPVRVKTAEQAPPIATTSTPPSPGWFNWSALRRYALPAAIGAGTGYLLYRLFQPKKPNNNDWITQLLAASQGIHNNFQQDEIVRAISNMAKSTASPPRIGFDRGPIMTSLPKVFSDDGRFLGLPNLTPQQKRQFFQTENYFNPIRFWIEGP